MQEVLPERLVRDPFLFLKKDQYEVKASGMQLSFNVIPYSSNWHTINTKCKKL